MCNLHDPLGKSSYLIYNGRLLKWKTGLDKWTLHNFRERLTIARNFRSGVVEKAMLDHSVYGWTQMEQIPSYCFLKKPHWVS